MLFFFNDTATTEIYTLSLHDALPISVDDAGERLDEGSDRRRERLGDRIHGGRRGLRESGERAVGERTEGERSEEHTSELQSQSNLACRLLLEKQKPHI